MVCALTVATMALHVYNMYMTFDGSIDASFVFLIAYLAVYVQATAVAFILSSKSLWCNFSTRNALCMIWRTVGVER